MGIDGAGKSTIGARIQQELEKTAVCELVWARYQPKFVKAIISPFRKKKVKSSQDYNNMSAKDYTAWTNSKKEKMQKHPILAKILYLIQYLEYSCQIKNVLNAKEGKHLIVDRYVLDFIVDQTINYGDVSKSLLTRSLLKKVVNFDKVLFINVDSEVAFKRKDDIPSLEYLNERRAIYLDYVKRLPNATCVCNNGDIEETMNEVKRVLGL